MNWRSRFRDVIWTSVVAVVCGLIAVGTAIAGVDIAIPMAFGLAGLIAARLGEE
jgi:hypothetical protein